MKAIIMTEDENLSLNEVHKVLIKVMHPMKFMLKRNYKQRHRVLFKSMAKCTFVHDLMVAQSKNVPCI